MSILAGAPLDEILPEDDAAKGRKPRQMKPATRRRVGNTGADGKLLHVERLVQPTLFQNIRQPDVTKLFLIASHISPPNIGASPFPEVRFV